MLTITATQLLAHAIGDYLLQSHWMATEKTKRSIAALVHVTFYAVPFLLLFRGMSWTALFVIVSTHFVIDRWRLARFVCWGKNFLNPTVSNLSWRECAATGFSPDTPVWLATWLLIFVDNIIHVIINGIALKYL